MAIRTVRATNFKSLKSLEVELRDFNVLIGPNASGKSSFIQIFKFLRDIENYGLGNAISMQGGVEYLRNINIGPSEPLSLEVVMDEKRPIVSFIRPTKDGEAVGVEPHQTTYKFSLNFKKKGAGFEISEDRLTLDCSFIRFRVREERLEAKEKYGEGVLTVSRKDGKFELEGTFPSGLSLGKEDMFPYLMDQSLPPTALSLERPFFPFGPRFVDVAIYDFDPKLPKKATPITGKAELEEDGSNLAIVLKTIIESREKKRKLANLAQDLLPFVTGFNVEKFADKSLPVSLRERYSGNQNLPASLISDGTLNITALIVALYFERKPITIIEEPERNIHPYLISKILGMMKDAARNKQILVSTHNPELVKHADLDDILLVSRDEQGFSAIRRASEKDEIKIFLSNQMGLEELYVQNLLGT